MVIFSLFPSSSQIFLTPHIWYYILNLQVNHGVYLVLAYYPQHGVSPEEWFIYPMRPYCSKLMFLLFFFFVHQKIQISDSFLVRYWSMCPFFSLSDDLSSGLNLYKSCAAKVPRVPRCFTVLCLEGTAFFGSSMTSISYNLSTSFSS